MATAAMVHDVVLIVHIAAGAVGLIVGATAFARPRRFARFAYQAPVAVVTVGAVGLSVMRWSDLWPFVLLAVGTEAAAVGSWWLFRRRPRQWEPWFVRLAYGSYISLITALLVVSWGSVLSWLVPTLVGSPLVERAAAQPSRRSLA